MKKQQYLYALLAFFLWGAWALWINYQQDNSLYLLSAIGQGTASFLITLGLTRAIIKLLAVFQDYRYRLIYAALIPVLITSSGLILLHFLLQTPSITNTIVPPLSVAFMYSLFIAVQESRNEGG